MRKSGRQCVHIHPKGKVVFSRQYLKCINLKKDHRPVFFIIGPELLMYVCCMPRIVPHGIGLVILLIPRQVRGHNG